jgi:hypothetical protein
VLHAVAGPLGTVLVSLPLLLAHDSYRRYLERVDGATARVAERRVA